MTSPFELQITVNGHLYSVQVHPMTRLLDVLRRELQLLGTKEGCGEGECGACSVLLNGELVNACLVPAIHAHQGEILTVEGLAQNDQLHPLQKAFWEMNGAQCGFCTPGMLMAAYAVQKEHGHASQVQIQEGLSGNLCRCTGYEKIVKAVQA